MLPVAAAADPRRTGLHFEPPPTRRDALLPAMDVAAFVGLAERGPLHQPVLLRDFNRFDVVFGGTARIAWDASRSRWVTAALRDAVRAFFANGGRRCWAVRVADEASAVVGQVAIKTLRPLVRRLGTVQADAQSIAEASSPGSWSDGLRLRLRLRVEPLDMGGLRWNGPAPQLPDAAREAGRRHLLRLRNAQMSETLLVVEGAEQPTLLWWLHDGPSAQPMVTLPVDGWSLERLSLDLQCAGVEALRLSLVAEDRRCWARVPELDPAFPVRGARREGEDEALAWYPDALETRWSEPLAIPADTRSVLRRDGLAGPLHACFVDPRLAESSGNRLLEEVRELRFGTDSSATPLRGLHALLASRALDDEAEAVSLIVLPDATQPPWASAEAPLALLPGVVLNDAHRAPEHALFAACDSPPWPALRWGDCGADLRERRLQLAWDEQRPAGALPTLGFEIEETGPAGTHIRVPHADLAIDAAAVRGERSPQPQEQGVYRFRLRALRQHPGSGNEAGPWSATMELVLRDVPTAQVASAEAAQLAQWQGLATVHRAVLKLAAARGDLVAMLSLPEQADLKNARQHIAVLRELEQQAPTTWPSPAAFGALYAPWLLTRGEDGRMHASPPDGAVCGLVARHTLERGPWVAPANQVLRGALGLIDSDISRGLDGLNPIETTPRGIAPMEARTLSTESELAPLQVRRLLVTLRRLLEREGRSWVFEPLGRALRGAVAQRLGQVLVELDRRGAFADEREPFQLRVDATGTASEATLMVELRLRPAAALRVLRLQLQTTVGAPVQWQETLE